MNSGVRSVRQQAVTSRIMSAVRNRNSVAELAVRRRLWANGLRFRVRTSLPGKPDIVFSRQKQVVFIDGDLWHGNSWRVRGLASFEAQFRSNAEWWVAKIRRNIARDREVEKLLASEGWIVHRYWESDVLSDPNQVARQVAKLVRGTELNFRDVPVTRLERKRAASVKLKLKASGDS
jgi:DNA mismatch endonuclease (patch repair protein)